MSTVSWLLIAVAVIIVALVVALVARSRGEKDAAVSDEAGTAVDAAPEPPDDPGVARPRRYRPGDPLPDAPGPVDAATPTDGLFTHDAGPVAAGPVARAGDDGAIDAGSSGTTGTGELPVADGPAAPSGSTVGPDPADATPPVPPVHATPPGAQPAVPAAADAAGADPVRSGPPSVGPGPLPGAGDESAAAAPVPTGPPPSATADIPPVAPVGSAPAASGVDPARHGPSPDDTGSRPGAGDTPPAGTPVPTGLPPTPPAGAPRTGPVPRMSVADGSPLWTAPAEDSARSEPASGPAMASLDAGLIGPAGAGPGERAAPVPDPYPGGVPAPADGTDPPSTHPVKVHSGSGRYHTPESPYYVRTRADLYFVGPREAEAAGFVAWNSRPGATRR